MKKTIAKCESCGEVLTTLSHSHNGSLSIVYEDIEIPEPRRVLALVKKPVSRPARITVKQRRPRAHPLHVVRIATLSSRQTRRQAWWDAWNVHIWEHSINSERWEYDNTMQADLEVGFDLLGGDTIRYEMA